MGSVRAEIKAKTRVRLVEAAIDVMRETGVHDASIQRICEQAGIAAGTFYVHFASRDALVDHVVERANASLAESMMAIASEDSPQSLRAAIERFAEVFAQYWVDHDALAPLFADHIARHPSPERLRIGAAEQVAGMVRRIIQTLPPDALRADPEFIVSTLFGAWRAFGLLVGKVDLEQRTRMTVDLARTTAAVVDAFAPTALGLDAEALRRAIRGTP